MGIVILAIMVAVLLVALYESIEERDAGLFWAVFFFEVVIGLLAVGLPTGVIVGTEHDPREYGEKQNIQSVDKQNDVYVFTMKDGETVARNADDVVVSDVSEEPGIQYGTTYHSWGIWWPGEDWDGREIILYTPSNKG